VGRSESTTSWEFHTPTPRDRPQQQDSKFKTPMIVNSPLGAASPGVEVEGAAGALLHTVSFYRAQKPATPVQQRVVVEPRLERRLQPAAESPRASLGQRIRRLEEEAAQQMPVIQQASSALNLCRATKEFFGSAEQVEGERLLLVASHKRAAALTQIQQLKTEGGLGVDPRQEPGAVRGTVSLCGITLGLKREFVEQLRTGEGGDFVHFFLCLVKCAGQVIPTTMVATADGLENGRLHFPNLIKFRDLSKDFTIQIEVYGLQTKKEVLNHEAKYHIAGAGTRPGGFLAQLTPKMKFSKTESRLARPAVSSPGGPHSVRTSSFAMVGQAAVTIGSLAETAWRLTSVPPISPLDGVLQVALNGHSESQVAHRGFLTMFDDASGIGVWHRRWLVLEGNTLSYWKYPENEAKQGVTLN
jgi:actin-binding protein anillin